MDKIIEACVETLEQCTYAETQGADQLELCACLDVGGTSPSSDHVKQVLMAANIPVKVMVRPRGGNFVYSAEEFKKMLATLLTYQSIGVEHVVVGMLNEEDEIDFNQLEIFSEAARSYQMKITFHKAIDDTSNILESTKALVASRLIDSILSSGGEETAWEGRAVLKEMASICGDAVELISAGKVTVENLETLHEIVQGPAYHGKRIV